LTPIEALKAGGLIREAITSYKISRAADEANDGQITFGGLDEVSANFSVIMPSKPHPIHRPNSTLHHSKFFPT
jgi:hypothetical protein